MTVNLKQRIEEANSRRLVFGNPDDIKLRDEAEKMCGVCEGTGERISKAKRTAGNNVFCGYCGGTGIKKERG